jgi:hypothetical protein
VAIRSADQLDKLTYLQLICNITESHLDRINTLLGLVDGDTMSDINKLKVELESAVYMVSTALIKVRTTFSVPANYSELYKCRSPYYELLCEKYVVFCSTRIAVLLMRKWPEVE